VNCLPAPCSLVALPRRLCCPYPRRLARPHAEAAEGHRLTGHPAVKPGAGPITSGRPARGLWGGTKPPHELSRPCSHAHSERHGSGWAPRAAGHFDAGNRC